MIQIGNTAVVNVVGCSLPNILGDILKVKVLSEQRIRGRAHKTRTLILHNSNRNSRRIYYRLKMYKYYVYIFKNVYIIYILLCKIFYYN